jgi:hypothetical protein
LCNNKNNVKQQWLSCRLPLDLRKYDETKDINDIEIRAKMSFSIHSGHEEHDVPKLTDLLRNTSVIVVLFFSRLSLKGRCTMRPSVHILQIQPIPEKTMLTALLELHENEEECEI